MKARFVTALYDLTISASLNRGEKIDEHALITNNQTVAGALVPLNANVAIGELEADSIRNSSAVIYANQVVPPNMPPAKFLLKKLAQVSGLLNSIWIYRDNSVNIELGFLFYTLDDVFKVDSNFLAHRNSMSNGKEAETRIDREELRSMRRYFREAMFLEDDPFDSVPRPRL